MRSNSDQVLGLDQQLYRLAIDEETGLRAYVLTNDKRFLLPFTEGREQIGKLDDELRQLISDNPEQEARNERASQAYREWSTWAGEVLAMANLRQPATGDELQLRGKDLMDQYRERRTEFEVSEKRLRDERFAASRKALRYVNLSIIAICLILASVLTYVGRKHLRHSHDQLERRVQERTRELQANNVELVHQAEVVRDLSGRLLQMQDEERRRLARDLHDGMGQLVAALGMNLSLLEREVLRLGQGEMRLVADSLASVQELSRELGRLPREMETSIFRVVQECLTNIHRHSASPTAGVRITCVNGDVRTEVWDAGKGISPEKQLLFSSAGRGGVGIRGMRERLRQFGGSLEVSSDANGTAVIATLPLAHPAAVAASQQVA